MRRDRFRRLVRMGKRSRRLPKLPDRLCNYELLHRANGSTAGQRTSNPFPVTIKLGALRRLRKDLDDDQSIRMFRSDCFKESCRTQGLFVGDVCKLRNIDTGAGIAIRDSYGGVVLSHVSLFTLEASNDSCSYFGTR